MSSYVTKYLKLLPARGFTLIEMLVAVAIFAVVASIVFPAMVEFLAVRERLDAKHKHIISLQKTFLFLAKDLRFASTRLPKDEYGELSKVTLRVDDDALMEFTAQYPDLNLGGLGVPRRVRWQLDDGQLERVQFPVMDPDTDTRVIKQTLLSDVEEVEIEFSMVEDGRDNTSTKWGEQTRMPDMIGVRVIMDTGIEYHRLFTMLSGDTVKATAASTASN